MAISVNVTETVIDTDVTNTDVTVALTEQTTNVELTYPGPQGASAIVKYKQYFFFKILNSMFLLRSYQIFPRPHISVIKVIGLMDTNIYLAIHLVCNSVNSVVHSLLFL